MTTKKKPATPEVTVPTPATAWKKSKGGGGPLSVPSGNVALVSPIGLQTLVASGKIPNSLMKFVNEALSTGKAPSVDKLDLNDQKTLQDMMNFMDEIVVSCVEEPRVYATPPEGSPREEDRLYVDEVDFEDKSFIFQFALGGTRDLEAFRAESAAYVADVQNGSNG